jgi:hypothetical protein
MKKTFDCVAFVRKRRDAMARKFRNASPEAIAKYYASKQAASSRRAA